MMKAKLKWGVSMITNSFFASFALALLLACSSNSSNPSVANGTEAKEDEFPAVTRIRMKNNYMTSSCSATWVHPRTLLTAAHCLVNDLNNTFYRPDQIFVIKGDQQIFVERAHLHENWRQGRKFDTVSFDLALLHFSEDISEHFVTVASEAPPIGGTVVLVGYGLGTADGSDSGIKRYGTNIIASVRGSLYLSRRINDMVRLKEGPTGFQDASAKNIPVGERVNNLQGDSGGPIFYQGRQVGVSATVSLVEDSKHVLSDISGNYVEPVVHAEWLRSTQIPICGLTEVCLGAPLTNDEIKNPLLARE
jgi:hypothetical protein